ncbi:MAG: hypothetical protein AB7H97_12670 [Pseudobdellovibrionaceae bacterium]
MKNIFLLLALLGLAACGKHEHKKHTYKAPPPTLHQQMVGFWKLYHADMVKRTEPVPRVLKLHVTRDNFYGGDYHQADFCGLGTNIIGKSSYKITGQQLEVNYLVYEFIFEGDKKAPLLGPGKFTGTITKISEDSFELDNNVVYVRFVPEIGSKLSDSSEHLCDEPSVNTEFAL